MFFSLTQARPTLLALGLMLLVPSLSACGQSTASQSTATNADNAVQIGVLVITNTEETRKRYQPVFDEISKAIDRPVAFVPVTQQSQFLMAETSNVDFIISNPLASAQLRQLHDTEIIATVSRDETNAQFGGVILVRPDSPINTVADLRDRRGACVSMTTAAAGCLFQLYHVQQSGLDPLRDLIIEEIPSQDQIVQKVISGEVDFGFVRTGQVEKMVQQGTLSGVDAVRVLEPVNDGYSLPHTTELYPEWALAAVQATSGDLVTRVQQAVLNLPEGSAALNNAGIEKFVAAEDYTKLDALVDALNL